MRSDVRGTGRKLHPAGTGLPALGSIIAMMGMFVSYDRKRQPGSFEGINEAELILVRINSANVENVGSFIGPYIDRKAYSFRTNCIRHYVARRRDTEVSSYG
jgi:hypothetical protein